jgi:17beta-estradiol 17-dehydrogenase / very-long-chain 3-oxoacyl-CoA reductase
MHRGFYALACICIVVSLLVTPYFTNSTIQLFFYLGRNIDWIVSVVPSRSLLLAAFFSFIGFLSALQFIFRQARFVYTQYFRTRKDLLARYGNGSWALITGASDGIGLGFAVEFARLGFNICLVSRTRNKLESAEMVVKATNPAVKTRIVVADFRSSGEQQFWDELARYICDIDISVLVNNVGINRTERFDTIDPMFLRDIVSVNCTSQLLMTRLLINSMLKRPLKSAIISISSVAGLRPLLYLSPYSATKAFNDFFSRALQLEVGDKIDVLSLRAGYVASNMSKLKETGGFVLDRYQCARGCIEKLGFVSETYGHVAHAVYGRSFIALPDYTIMQQRKRRLLEKQDNSSEGKT